MFEKENIINIPNDGKSNSLNELLSASGISGRLARRLFKNNLLLVNGRPAVKGIQFKADDLVSLIIQDEKCEVEPEKMELQIVFEDRDVLVINKPPFIIVHPTANILYGTLSNGVSAYFIGKGLKRKVRLVNRLDRDTSGLVIYAKNSYSHQYLARQMEKGEMKKKYIAVVKGHPVDSEGIIELPIGISNDGIRNEIRHDGMASITKYRMIEEYGRYSLLELELLTGRTHQLRVHLSSIGNPILGDTLYGRETDLIARQALHAISLEFRSSETGCLVEITAPIPVDIIELINAVKDH
jgi:23S rRNA pseudouridine1911/1915/1917 synthase